MGRKKRYLILKDVVFQRYYNRLTEIAMSRYQWNNLPPTCDERFLEMTLCQEGQAIFFNDSVLGYLALQTMIGGDLNVYRIPNRRTAFATNGYHNVLTNKDSVIIYNNYLHNNDINAIEQFSMNLCELEYIAMINCKAQKTPILLSGSEKQIVSLLNMYESYEGNAPMTFVDKNTLGEQPIKATTTGAPFVADKIYEMKTKIWNEALTYLGIPNISQTKKERMIKDEVERQNGGTLASRNSGLYMRRKACEEINEMFGLDISVVFRDGLEEFSQLNSNERSDLDDKNRDD